MPLLLYSPKRKSTVKDASWAMVSMLMNFEAGYVNVKNGATLTVAGTGSAGISSSGKFGSNALSLDKAYLTTNDTSILNFGTSDFTIEAWINPSVSGKYLGIMSSAAYEAGGFGLRVTSGNQLNIYCTSFNVNTVGTPISSGSWNHVAVTRTGGTIYLFVNGVLGKSFTSGADARFGSTFTRVGDESQGSYLFKGLIDEVRVTKGVCRYTGNFPVPTAAFPTS